jgi:hypothetical protein
VGTRAICLIRNHIITIIMVIRDSLATLLLVKILLKKDLMAHPIQTYILTITINMVMLLMEVEGTVEMGVLWIYQPILIQSYKTKVILVVTANTLETKTRKTKIMRCILNSKCTLNKIYNRICNNKHSANYKLFSGLRLALTNYYLE